MFRELQQSESYNHCQRCDGVLKRWPELTVEEQEVVKRLPGAADYNSAERRAMHRWCTRCWYESVDPDGDMV